MQVLPIQVQKLINLLERLPGLGPKSAARIALYLLRSPKQYTKELGAVLTGLHEGFVYCNVCQNIASEDPCVICSSSERDTSVICVVEDPLDVVAFERGTDFSGRYHVLGGVISPVNGVGPEDITIQQLIQRISEENVSEIIIATNPNMEGEATAMYIKEEVLKLPDPHSSIKISRLARGLPTGADLEYADKTTISRAFEGRTEL